MLVKVTWEFDADVEDFDPRCVDIEEIAKDSAKREMEFMIDNNDITAEDFSYEVVKEN